jgi:hypothetical protein
MYALQYAACKCVARSIMVVLLKNKMNKSLLMFISLSSYTLSFWFSEGIN